MAGIYIPGVKMPTSCRKCKLKMNCDDCEGRECCCLPLGKNIGYMDDEPRIPSEKRRDDCPLFPVPNHGRLIEKQAVYDLIRSMPDVDMNLPVNFMKALYELPTIMPADKEAKL